MTILITGGTGLVGSRLLKRMIAAGEDCRVIIRSDRNIPAGAVAIKGDLLDPTSLEAAVEGVSAIIHLAAVLRTPDSDDIWKANVDGTKNLIHAARQHAPNARFIMASTGLVYNANSAYPAREGDAVDPKMAYPASKVAAEKQLHESGLNWSILRLGFVYGDDDGHLQSVPRLANMFKWHPANKLSLIHHRDIAAAVLLALNGAMDGRIVNLTDEAPMSVYEIAHLVGATMEPSAEPQINPWFGQLDGSLARALGFQPVVATLHQSLREGST
ncbi:NAD(P)-dependent oxidoreductase [Devosia algicola]|uniref:NAD(P)-dependent oxidoreductase n=1 Tax=Devosia algicola TaxID=3026418 RepID=A0ABY7YJM0_9HYPH|nr:NAD(P)-dependent oxidoreductase [Devosia algicola]WDR01399.1 NAD(P)-dependent oxidoreductase [Devosia algicola]